MEEGCLQQLQNLLVSAKEESTYIADIHMPAANTKHLRVKTDHSRKQKTACSVLEIQPFFNYGHYTMGFQVRNDAKTGTLQGSKEVSGFAGEGERGEVVGQSQTRC